MMSTGIMISPEELYFLGILMKAKYIDYAYIAAMDDIGQNYGVFESAVKDELIEKGCISEDFSGTVFVSSDTQALLEALFFGETEASLDVCTLGSICTVDVIKYHFSGNAAVSVRNREGKLLIDYTTAEGIRSDVQGIVGEMRRDVTGMVPVKPEEVTVKRIISAKKSSVVGRSTVVTYLDADSVLFSENNEKMLVPQDSAKAAEELFGLVKEDLK